MDDTSSVHIEIVDLDVGGDNGNGASDDVTTVDVLLRRAAERSPSRLAYADPPNRSAFGLGPPGHVNFAEADEKASLIAARLIQAGLLPGDRIALRLPNMIELPLVLTGAWRAGLVPVCLPLLWQMSELHHALPQINPAAIVTVGRIGNANHSETMCEAAAQNIAVRHVFGIGGDLADGVTPAGDWFTADAKGAALDAGDEIGDLHDAPAAMTWDSGKHGTFPVPRTHRELLALARMAAGQLALDSEDVVLTTYPMTSITSLAGQMVAALHAGATMLLHQPFSYDAFIAQLRDFGATFTAVPGSVFKALHERGDLDDGNTKLRKIARVWPWPHQPSEPGEAGDGLPVFEMQNIGELGLVIERAPAPPGLPLGKLTLSEDAAGIEDPYLETRVRGSVSTGPRRVLSGALLMRGPTVPAGPFDCAGTLATECLQPDPQGFLNTGLYCSVEEERSGRFMCARHSAIIYHGGMAIDAAELDSAFASFPDILDAAALPVEDSLMGERILAAVVSSAEKAPSLHNFRMFLSGKGLADYKFPEQIVVVRSIPRDAEGKVLRTKILDHI